MSGLAVRVQTHTEKDGETPARLGGVVEGRYGQDFRMGSDCEAEGQCGGARVYLLFLRYFILRVIQRSAQKQ